LSDTDKNAQFGQHKQLSAHFSRPSSLRAEDLIRWIID